MATLGPTGDFRGGWVQKKELPHLDIVALRDLILHEEVEEYRVSRIMERLEADGTLRNPPIVGRGGEESRQIVLDGASRVSAARRLGFPHMLVQVVPYPSPTIDLDRWNHLVVGMDLARLCELAGAIPGVSLRTSTWKEAAPALEQRQVLACFRAPRRRPVLMSSTASAKIQFDALRELTLLYATDPGLHRVREDQVRLPDEWMGEDHVLVLFARYRQEDIVRFSLRLEERLPMGITRHSVPNRALRVHYPISVLRGKETLREKRRHLRGFLEDLWSRGRIRPYPEPTTLYDE